jgi:hypothetical protein
MSDAPTGTGDATSTTPTTSTVTTTAPTFQPAAPAPSPPAKEDGKHEDLGDAGAKAIAAERKARKEADARAAALQAKVDEHERAKLSEQEKAAKDLADARKAADEAKAEAARFQLDALKHRIAAEKGVPARLLAGGTEDELTVSADEALKWRGEATPPPPKAPKPDQTVGPRGGQPISGADLYRQMHPNRTPATTGQ